MKKLKVLKDKISVKLMLLYATILSVMPFDVFAEDRNVNTKYFGNKQEFWGELKTWYLWFMGFLWFVTILMIFLAASKASAKVSIAKIFFVQCCISIIKLNSMKNRKLSI